MNINEPEEKGLVSVIIPSYNRAQILHRAIDSVLCQTYRDTEILVIDDGSSDNTLEVLDQYDSEVQVISQSNTGAAAARNNGINKARGEFIAFLDSDDEWMPHKLEKQIACFKQNNELGLVSSGMVDITSDGKKHFPRTFAFSGFATRKLIKYNFVNTSSVVVKTDCLRKMDSLFDTSFKQRSDWQFWIRFSARYKFQVLPNILCNRYFNDDSLGRSLIGHDAMIELNRRIYESLFSDELLSDYFNKNWKTIMAHQRMLSAHYFYHHGEIGKARSKALEAIRLSPFGVDWVKVFGYLTINPSLKAKIINLKGRVFKKSVKL